MSVRGNSGWIEIPAADVAHWNARLLTAGAELYQFPYWNESLRVLHLTPHYFVYRDGDGDEAYAAVVTFGIPGWRIGLIRRGPVNLRGAGPLPHRVLTALTDRLRELGLIFVRFSHANLRFAHTIAALGEHESIDSFPFLHEVDHDLVVPLPETEDALLTQFSATARRKIRKAAKCAYRIDYSVDPEALDESWPLFEALSLRKKFWFRPRASFHCMMRHARPEGSTRLYRAWLDGRLVQAILIGRDRDAARYLVGALDLAALNRTPSPSCLLHWRAMADSRALGCSRYSLGTDSGVVYQFKQQFHPVRMELPAPVTLILAPRHYALWSKATGVLFPRWWQIKKALFEPHPPASAAYHT